MDWGLWHCTGDRDQDHSHGKEMQKSKMAVWGGLTNSCESPWQWLNQTCCCCCSVAKSYSLLLHGLQHARLFCTPLSPGVCSDSCPLSQWCHQTTSSFVVPFSFCLQSLSAFHIGWPEYWSFSISPSNPGLISFRADWFDPPEVQGTLNSLLQHQFFGSQSALWTYKILIIPVGFC